MQLYRLFHVISSGFTSGTTNGTFSSILNAELLSTTIQPFEAAIGAYFLEVSPPAEKIAKSNPSSNEFSVSSLIMYCLPKKSTVLPLELEEAKSLYSAIGSFFSSKTLRAVLPTRPVAPNYC